MKHGLFILSLIFTSSFCFSQWESVFLVRWSLEDVYFVNNKTGYISGSDREGIEGVILRTDDSGISWKVIHKDDSPVQAVNFINADTGYALCGFKVLKTTDKGDSWNETSLSTSHKPLDIMFTSDLTGYISCEDGQLMKTTNAGLTWKKTNSPVYSETLKTSVDFVNDDLGYMVADYNVHKTENGGLTWERMYPLNYRYERVFFVNENTGYICAVTGETYKTTDGGLTWLGVSSYGNIPYFINENTGFLFANYSNILRSSNGAESFELVYTSDWDFSWKAVHFADEQFGCAIGSNNSVAITTNGGYSWKLVNITPNTGSYRDMHFSSDMNGIAVGVNRGVFRTNDGGNIWFYDEKGFRKDLFMLSFADPLTGIVVVTNNWAYYTNNGGWSFYEVDWTVPIIGQQESYDYFMTHPDTIFTVGLKVQLTRSTDGGESWQSYYFDFYNGLNRITCPTHRICFACGTRGKTVRTTNAGESWENMDIITSRDLTSIFFYDPQLGFCGGEFGTLIKTTDGGNQWESLKTGIFNTIIGIRFYNPSAGVIVSRTGEVAITNDGGVNWQKISPEDSFLEEIHNIYFKDFRIFAMGKSIYYYDIGDITGMEEQHSFYERELHVYPNPATDEVTVSVSNGILTDLIVMDPAGKVLMHSANIYQPSTALKLNTLPKGVYLIRVKTSQGSFVRKIIRI